MTEVAFLNELVIRTGCGLLCDVSNIYLSARNMGFDPERYVEELPIEAIAEFHLGGFTAEDDDAEPGGSVLIDTHAAAVSEPAWMLYAHAVRCIGPVPTLIERDSALPALSALIAEAKRADSVIAALVAEEVCRAAAG